MSRNDPRDALTDMVKGLTSTFKQYDMTARRKAWQALTSAAGKAQVEKLITSPGRPVVGLSRLLSFKEWLANQAE